MTGISAAHCQMANGIIIHVPLGPTAERGLSWGRFLPVDKNLFIAGCVQRLPLFNLSVCLSVCLSACLSVPLCICDLLPFSRYTADKSAVDGCNGVAATRWVPCTYPGRKSRQLYDWLAIQYMTPTSTILGTFSTAVIKRNAGTGRTYYLRMIW